MKELLATLALTLGISVSMARSSDGAAAFIQFRTVTEELAFQRLLEKPTHEDVIELLLAGDPREHGLLRTVVEERIAEFRRTEKISQQAITSVKQLKLLFTAVQSRFLVRYDPNALFADLFMNGDFNCVTASALIALLLDGPGTPYSIHLTPDHVYLTTIVQGTPSIIESTDPIRGIFPVGERDRKKYVAELLRSKRISQGQLDSLGLEGTLSTLSRTDTLITMAGLVGTHYHNAGIQLVEKDVAQSIVLLSKAWTLNPYPITKEALSVVLLKHVGTNSYDRMEDVEFLLSTHGFLKLSGADQLLIGDHARLLEKHLSQRSDTTMAKDMLEAFLNAVSDSSAREEIIFMHHAGMGRYYGLKRRPGHALEHLLIANSIQPENAQVADMVSTALIEKLERTKDRSSLEPYLNELIATHPQLAGTTAMDRCYMIVYLISAEDHFNIDQRSKAETFLNKFEERYTTNSDLPVNAIAGAYLSGWRSWARARQAQKAQSYVARGLQIAPFNEDLFRASKYTTY